MEYISCLKKQEKIKQVFTPLSTPEEGYQKIISLGQQISKLDQKYLIPENLVAGCQSRLYLRSHFDQERVYFQIYSDALISAGLAALLLEVYSGEPPKAILKCPPNFLKDLKIFASITPNRSNGLTNVFNRMKQQALFYLVNN